MDKKIGNNLISIFILMLFAVGITSFVASASSGVTVIYPYNGEHITLINPKVFIFNVSIYAPTDVGYPVAIDSIRGPNGIVSTGPISLGSIGSNGYLNVTEKLTTGLFEKNGEPITQFVPGTYYIYLAIANVFSENISVILTPNNIATLNITAIANGKPLPSATINIYNESNGQLLVSGTTNSEGYVVFEVPYVYTMTNVYNVTLTKAGYQFNYTTVTVPANYFFTVPVKIYTEPVVFVAIPFYYEDMGIKEIAPPQEVDGIYVASAFQNSTFSVIVNVTQDGVPVSNAIVTAEYNNTYVTATYIGDGMYNISITIPQNPSDVPYTLVVIVSAQYHSSVSSFPLIITAEPNLYQEIATLKLEVSSLNATINMLKSELAGNITELNNTIASLKNEIASLNSSIQTLETEYSSLNSTFTSDISTLNSQISTLKSDVSTLSSEYSTLSSEYSTLKSDYNSLKGTPTLAYVGIALGVIGIIIAIVALVLVLRKVA
jgi:archaellum component FlaC